MVLRENCVTPRLVNNYSSMIAGEQGSTIDVPIPSSIAAVDVVPGATAPDAGALLPKSVPVALTNWKEVAFDLTDQELSQVMNGYVPRQAEAAIASIITAIDQSILANYVSFFGHHGTAGTTPFGATPGVSDATGIRKVLEKQLAPKAPRHVMLDPDAEAAALGLQHFADMNFSGSSAAIADGLLNTKLGMQWWMNQNMPKHVRNAVGAGAMTVNGVNAVAAFNATQSLSIAKAAGASWSAKKGDLITIAHGGTVGTRQYVILADVSVVHTANTTVTIYPALAAATAGGEVITSIDTHQVNLAFHQDAIAFASRPLLAVPDGLGSLSLSQADPISGIALRVEVVRQHKRTRWSYDCLWGTACPRPELGARLLG